jgi:TonB-linked SusC/RagA family outer membrane protein
MRRLHQLLAVFAVFIFTATAALAQNRTVKGKVTNNSGEPLSGASVTVKGTTIGTISAEDGGFSLEVPASARTLVISYSGYQSKEVTITEGTISVQLILSSTGDLGEVVVIGYGDQRKRKLATSVASVKEAAIKEIPTSNFQQALQGRTPGVLVNQNSGDPRGSFQVLIRGINSLTLSSEPLFVVDGVPLFNTNLYHINPDDIERVDVLKDAPAAGIYGTRAANGVVMITTKRGRTGKPLIELSADYGVQRISNPLQMMNSREYAKAWDNGRILRGQATEPAFQNPNFFSVDNNYIDAITRQAPWQRYSLSASGGAGKTNYAISGSYEDRDGVIINTAFKRASLRTNLDFALSNKVKVGTSMAFSSYWGANTSNDGVFGNNFVEAVYSKPWVPIFDSVGNFTGPTSTSGPYSGFTPAPIHKQTLDERNINENRLFGSFYAEYEILKGLKFKSVFGGDAFYSDNYSFNPLFNYGVGEFVRVQNSVTRSFGKIVNWVADQTLNYNKIYNSHNITVLAGYSAQQNTNYGLTVTRSGATDNNFNQLNNNQPNIGADAGSGVPVRNALNSYFGRIQYDYDDKYFATVTVRRDATSKFGKAFRWGTFPSVGLAWRVSSEKFMDNVQAISDLKIRASWGQSGNQAFGEYNRFPTIGAATNIFGTSATLSRLGNDSLKWEASEQIDLGFDLSLFGNKLSITFDYFKKTNRDLIVDIPVPAVVGTDVRSQTINFGSLLNKGIELGINGIFKFGAFEWEPGLTLSTYKNTIQNVGRNPDGSPVRFFGTNPNDAVGPINISVEGKPVGSFYGLNWLGVYQTGQPTGITNAGVGAGDFIFEDINKDGKIDANDRTFIGDPNPDFFGGFNNNFRYKGVTLGINTIFSVGNDIYNVNNVWLVSGYPGFNMLKSANDYWNTNNPSTRYPKPFSAVAFTYNSLASTRWVEDGSYLRIKNISLGYELPRSAVRGLGLKAIRLTVVGTNLFTFTKYTGIDPENNSGNNIGSNQLSQGLDIIPYPFSKSYMVKLNLSL